MESERPYLTVPEAASLLGVSPGAVRHWCKNGTFECKRLGGNAKRAGRVLVVRESLIEALR